MNVLVTGANGFVGKNLVENLKTIRDGKNKTRPNLIIDEIFEYDVNSNLEELNIFCKNADFVFNLAGANRPKDNTEFKSVNTDFASALLELLKNNKNNCPVMLASSVQATLAGRFGDSEYGRSKRAGEELYFQYEKETGAKVLVYRFPNIVGKWIKPNYNSAVGTFCNNIANELPITISDPSVQLELLFVEDLVEEMFDALEGREHHAEFKDADPIICDDGKYCYAPITHKATLGYIVECLKSYHNQPESLIIPQIPEGSFEKKLYSMYLSYLPYEKIAFDLKMNTDERGSFTELLKTKDCGQFSVNIFKPGITKGNHWHNSKWEYCFVVHGHGKIQQRKIGTDEIVEFEVSGNRIQAVHMLPGYAHNIINLSQTEEMVAVLWANEQFDINRPDTFFEIV